MTAKRYRLVTKRDLDGLASAILLKEIDLVDRIAFAHPQEIASGLFPITEDDITAGLPYRAEAHLVFDHYPDASAASRPRSNAVVDTTMPSTSRVIYRHYGRTAFARVSRDMLHAVDKGFGGAIGISDILNPSGWMLLNHLIDHRTRLEQFAQFSVATDQLMISLNDYGREHTIWEILTLPAVEERTEVYFAHMERHKEQLLRCSVVHSNLVVADLRQEPVIYPGNRFMIYALFPECNVSMQVTLDAGRDHPTIAVGKSVLDRSYSKDLGAIMRRYGGGGHANAGACSIRCDQAEPVKDQLIRKLKYNTLANLFFGYFNWYQYQS
jgi:nanoRNase/pAp phosphatase (c-di-AMP/oligoRNAs hydrolase)